MSKCLYNGIKLPALPSWDNITYPYAIIYADTGGAYWLVVSIYKWVYMDNRLDTAGSSLMYLYDPNQVITSIASKDWYNDGSSHTVTSIGGDRIIWSNHDITDIETNTIYLAKSDPVETIDNVGYISRSVLEDIANEIRLKSNNPKSIPVQDLAEAIRNINTSPSPDNTITTDLDFANWDNGTFTETLSDGSTVTHTVTLTDGIPTKVDDITIEGLS